MSPVLVYGGGVPALATTLALLDAGIAVTLAGPTDAARHPHLPEGGIACGHDADALTQQLARGVTPGPAHRAIAEAAPTIVDELVAMGVPFARDGDELALRRLPGCPRADAAYVGASTAQITAWTLDVAVSRPRPGAPLRRLPERELLELVRDDGGAVVGAILVDRANGAIEGVGASAVILAATGAVGSAFGASARLFPEVAVAAGYRAGARLAGTGRPRRHAALLAHGRHPQPLSSALRAEGARYWVPVDDKEARIPRDIPSADRDYFAEEELGKEASLEHDDTLAALVRRVTRERGVHDRVERANKATAYLDLSHLPAGHLEPRVGDELAAIAARAPRDPRQGPCEVHAGAVSWGAALSVEADGERGGSTSVEGLWAVGTAAWGGVADAEGTGLLVAIHHGRRVAASVALAVEEAGDAADATLEKTRAAAEGALGEAPEVADAATTVAELLDALAFGDEEPGRVAARLAELLDELGGSSVHAGHRGLVAGLEVGLAACAMHGRAATTEVRRADDGTSVVVEGEA